MLLKPHSKIWEILLPAFKYGIEISSLELGKKSFFWDSDSYPVVSQ